jgi:hypothetical protein
MAELQIQIGADVNSAIRGLNQVQTELEQTGADAVKFGNSVEGATAKIRKLPQVTNQATFAITNLSRVVQDAPFGFIGIQNNINPLLDSFTALKASTGSTGGALKALAGQLIGPAGLGFAVSVASSLFLTFGSRLFDTGKAAEKAKSDSDKLRDSINGIFSETAKEAASVNGFIAILKNETETRERKLAAIKELQQIQPQVFAGLKLEGEAVIGLDSAYTQYLNNLKTVIAVKIKQAQLEQLIEKQLKLQGVTLTNNEKILVDGTKRFQNLLSNDPRLQGTDASRLKQYYINQEAQSKKTLAALEKDIKTLQDDIVQLSAGIETKTITIKPGTVKLSIPKIANLSGEAIEIPPITEEVVVPLQNVILDFTDLKLSKQLANIRAQYDELGLQLPPINIQALIQNPEILDQFNEKLSETYKRLGQVGAVVSGVFGPAFDNLFASIENGGNAIGNFFDGLAQGIKQLVQALLQTAAIAGLVSLITGTPFAANFKLISGLTLPGRANGGPVSGGNAYLVGERGPELFVPSVSGGIVPNNSVGSFMGGRMSGGGSSSVLRGQDILLAYARTQRSQLRVNG